MFDTHGGTLVTNNGQHPFTSGSTTGELLIVLQMGTGPGGGTALVDNLWLQVVPEPSTYVMTMLGIGLLIPAVYRQRRRSRNKGRP